MNNSLILRRYAVKQPALPKTTGVPVHKLVHNAMLDAANEAGLVPHDVPGHEQYHTFAKYRDMAHEELANPGSPFTKMFNRHKSEISKVQNPQEHLKNALTPMFKYLATKGNRPKSEEPIDLLDNKYSPLEESGEGGFEFKPHVPSGFVEVPQHNEDDELKLELPKEKRKAFPNRGDIYKSIAEHADMGWSAPAKLKDYLVQKHGITPQEASVHIANFRRRQNKPAAPTPQATKRVWPPIQRKSRSKDLMEIPYGRSTDDSGHFLDGAPKRPRRLPIPRPAPRGWGEIDTRSPGGYPGWEEDFPDQIHEITLDDDEHTGEEEPIQHSAYRAPAGGAVVRGSQYKGGEMIPDMASSFMNPRRKLSRKYRNFSQ